MISGAVFPNQVLSEVLAEFSMRPLATEDGCAEAVRRVATFLRALKSCDLKLKDHYDSLTVPSPPSSESDIPLSSTLQTSTGT